jgi:DNA-binding transcriptional ArsR family regulator
MNQPDLDEIATCAKALSNPTSNMVFHALSSAGEDGMRLSDLARVTGVASHVLPTHLKHLAQARLVKFRRTNNRVHYSVNEEVASKFQLANRSNRSP